MTRRSLMIATGLLLLLVVALVPPTASAQNGYCKQTSGTSGYCCTYYSNGNRSCQNYTYSCQGNTQDENRRCGWTKQGSMYEPDGCLYLPIMGDIMLMVVPTEAQPVLLAADALLGGDMYVGVPQPVSGYMPDA